MTDGAPLELQHGSAVVRYGGDAGGELLPVLVDHDRSRHSERQVLLMLLALLKRAATGAGEQNDLRRKRSRRTGEQ